MNRIPPPRRAFWIGVLAPALWLSATTCDSTTRPATAPAAKLTVAVQPAGTKAGEPIGPVITVQVTDASGRVVTASEAAVRLRLAAGTGSPHAHLLGATEVAAVNGVATFPTVSVDSAATGYRLTATSPGLDSALTASFAVAVGPAARLAFSAAPVDVTANTPFDSTVRVIVLDRAGNLVPTSAAAIALAIGANPAQGRLLGTTNRNATGGVAGFSGVRIDKPGDRYTLTASAPGLTPAVMQPFPVTRAVVAIGAGYGHSCALTADSTAYCWGDNTYGQLGDGTKTASAAPVRVAGGFPFAFIGIGDYHACAGTDLVPLRCWGLNADGELGDGSSTTASAPVPVSGGLALAAVDGGSAHTCGITTSGAAFCWGSNVYGEIGKGLNDYGEDVPIPTAVSGGHAFARISAGGYHTCALTAGGAAWCWGDNYYGQLGDPSSYWDFWEVPVQVSGGIGFAAISAGRDHTCGLSATLFAYCWGNGYRGAVGDGTSTTRETPVPVAGGQRYAAISAGWDRSCGLTLSGAAYCWGAGPLGNGGTTDSPVPVAVAGAHTFATISAGYQICALTASGAAYCWGSDLSGRSQVLPERVPLF